MNYILYFPGNSLRNKDERDLFEDYFASKSMPGYFHGWEHWITEREFDEDLELAVLKDILEDLDDIENFNVLGKSMGTFFSCLLLKHASIKVENLILMGVPLGIGEERIALMQEVIKHTEASITIFQNEFDPYGPLEKVKELFGEYAEIVVREGDETHQYAIAEEVGKVL